MTTPAELPFGLVLTLSNDVAQLSSEIRREFADDHGEVCAVGHAAADAMESFLLALHAEGVDVRDVRVVRALTTAVAACAEQLDFDPALDECALRVSLDGGVTYRAAPEGVRVICPVTLDDGQGELHVNHTHEGLITDVWVGVDGVMDHHAGTRSVMADELAFELVNEAPICSAPN